MSPAGAVRWLGSGIALLMMAAATAALAGHGPSLRLWSLPEFGAFAWHVDALSGVFLFAAGLVYLPCCWFAADQLPAHSHPSRFTALHFFLMATVVALLTASNVLTFLIAWEAMSILSFLLIGAGEADADPHAGYLLLAMGEAGFLAIVVALLIAAVHAQGGSFDQIRMAASSLSPLAAGGIFALGLAGFGVKAGLVPINSWLPRAYAAAPPAFVPILAGVTLNLGLYGIVRLDGDLVPGHSPGPGLAMLLAGTITALIGILYATTENDLKRILAHSSIENAGIVVAATGAYLVFRATGHPAAAAIALTAALYHMLNHSVYKALLFQGAVRIESASGTRNLDELGALIRPLAGLSVVFLVGCLSIAALPPFNGFTSEWLTLQSLLRGALLANTGAKVLFALCGAGLALTAALAITCFVKVFAMGFLGTARGRPVQPRPGGIAPMAFLAVACLLLGILPTYVIPALDPAVQPLASVSAAPVLVPPFFTATPSNGQLPASFLHDFHQIGAQTGAGWLPGRGLVLLLRGRTANPVVFAMSPAYSLAALALFLLIVWWAAGRVTHGRAAVRGDTWAGGLARLLPEYTYTATGFSNPVRVVFQAIFRPGLAEDVRETVGVHFRTAIRRHRDERYVVDRWFAQPFGRALEHVAAALARLHHGRLQSYATYVLAFLLAVLFLYRLSW